MKKKPNEPIEPPPEDSLKKLADFTKRILRVPKDELKDKPASTGTNQEPLTDTIET
jgi:hypothetical protein